jgi:hypothetical protein
MNSIVENRCCLQIFMKILALISRRQGCRANAGLHWTVMWSDNAAGRIISKQLDVMSLKVSCYRVKSASLSALVPDVSVRLSFQFPSSMDVELFLVPMFSAWQLLPSPDKEDTERLNSLLQQFNLTKCPFIMLAVGLQHTSQLNTGDVADLMRYKRTSKVSTSRCGAVITRCFCTISRHGILKIQTTNVESSNLIIYHSFIRINWNPYLRRDSF